MKSEQNKNPVKGRWTEVEHQAFLDSLRKYGKDWYRVEEAIGTRNSAQIRSHAQKFLYRMEKEPELEVKNVDIKEILDVNLRLLTKEEKTKDGYEPPQKKGNGRGKATYRKKSNSEIPLA